MGILCGKEVDEGVEDDRGHDVNEERDYFFAGILASWRKVRGCTMSGGRGSFSRR